MAAEVDRDWIVAQLLEDTHAERSLADLAENRRESPPEPSLAPTYRDIADDDARHCRIVETIAVRYGHTPSRGGSGGIGEAVSRLKDRLGDLRTTPVARVEDDLQAKAHAIHRYSAWIAAFEAMGDAESARELAAILTEETAHRDALLEGLRRLFTRHTSPDSTT